MFTVLCPTDFSDVATNAIAYASEIAKQLKGRLHLTHILYPTYMGMSPDGIFLPDIGMEDVKNISNNRLQVLADELRLGGVTVTVSTEYGFWDSVLSDLQDRVKPDLLVTGTKGAGSIFTARLMGMNTLTMVDKIDCPVLAVPLDFKFSKMSNIVYATDYQFEDIDHAEFVVKLAKHNSAQIDFVHVSASNKDVGSDKELMEWFKDMVQKQLKYSKTMFSIVIDSDTEDALEGYALNQNVDLLCVSMRHRSALQQFFSHSHTHKFIVDAVVPILVFHLREDFKL